MRLIILFLLFVICWMGCGKYDDQDGAYKDDFVFELRDTAGVKADGASSVTLRLRNTLEVKQGLRVIFESSKGTVLVKEQPYLNGLAETKLLLTEDTGSYAIKATLKEGDVVKLEKFITVAFPTNYPPQNFSYTVTDSTGTRANGASAVKLLFTGPANLKPGMSVHFETNKGSILQPDITYSAGASSTLLTVSQDTGNYSVKAQLKDGAGAVKVEKLLFFSFRAARADAISLEATSATWTAPNPINIRTQLTRLIGKVSPGQAVFFRAFQVVNPGDTQTVARFEGLLNNLSKADGTLSDIKLFPDTPGLDITKAIGLVAKTLSDRGDTVRTYLSFPHL